MADRPHNIRDQLCDNRQGNLFALHAPLTSWEPVMLPQRLPLTAIMLVALLIGCGTDEPGAATSERLESTTADRSEKSQSHGGAPIPVTMKSLMHPVRDGMQVLEQTSERVVFAGEPGDIYSLTLKQGDPGLPNDITELRQVIRRQAAAENGGIVQVEKIDVKGLKAFLFLTKDVGTKFRGYRYVGRCVIPAEGCWFEVRMDCVEMGTTGQREAVATDELLRNGDVKYEPVPPDAPPTPGGPPGPGARRIKGWSRDPYDAAYDSQANLTVSDDPKYDELIPSHPLSRLRREFPDILDRLVVSDELRASAERLNGAPANASE